MLHLSVIQVILHFLVGFMLCNLHDICVVLKELSDISLIIVT